MAKNNLQKLELTWIGKGEEPKLEPRILIENPEYSYGDPESGNMLIHGDNLLALKALEQDFAGKVKCIYIDPPFNTGAAFEHYDDNIEHSIWLNLMYQRIKLLYGLLSDDGIFFLHLDDLEVHYAKIICDEIFRRSNFVVSISIRSSTPSGVKTAHKDKTIIKQKDTALVYRKSEKTNFNPQYIRRPEWDTHFNYFINDEKLYPLVSILKEFKIIAPEQTIKDFSINNKTHKDFYIKNAEKICQTQSFRNDEIKQKSREHKDKILYINKDQNNELMFYNGRQLTPLKNSINDVFYNGKIEKDLSVLLCDFWSDIDFQNTQNEGGVDFPNSKKPESLILRILNLCTSPGDIVLDSFLGSGTTTAVAQKMNRRWIGIELGDHAVTHCYPRMKAVVDGEQGGISKAVNWKGGGGFKFYELAPSLLNKDKFDNWIISPQYNPAMLTAAMAKQEGFIFQPHESIYWKQGRSSEQDFIFTTTQFLTVEVLDNIHDEMQPDESLLICCKAFQKECKKKYPNITIKKIPQMLLGRCEFGKDDYSLNIVNLPTEEQDEDWDDFDGTNISTQDINTQEENNQQLDLF